MNLLRFNPLHPALLILPALLMGLMGIAPRSAQALPGDTAADVRAWIQAHPTLKPGRGETLMVRKSNSASQRFIFEASLLSPGKISTSKTGGFIRSEKLTLFDMLNGITPFRLQESLRSIYGADVFQDYDQGQVVFTYPDPLSKPSIGRQSPLSQALQGELRQGSRYAYWLEIARSKEGVAYAGRIIVFLKEDLNQLQTELRNR